MPRVLPATRGAQVRHRFSCCALHFGRASTIVTWVVAVSPSTFTLSQSDSGTRASHHRVMRARSCGGVAKGLLVDRPDDTADRGATIPRRHLAPRGLGFEGAARALKVRNRTKSVL